MAIPKNNGIAEKTKIRRYEKMEELIELLEEIQPDADF